MESLPLLVPLVVLIPAVGALINYFWGGRLDERWSSLVGIVAALLSFVVSLVLYNYLLGNNFQATVVNPPFLDGWLRIDSIGFEISWQQRVDTLSVTMMLVVTGVGSLIHIYARGYMHGDNKFPLFFAYLNMFLMFMLILVTGNNLLMLFVGWEGVGLCSYLLIGFWWDKKAPEGWKNSNAARKAFIVNRIGDFGMLMAMFLIFIAFGTLDFYRPGEIANVDGVAHAAETDQGAATDGEGEHGEATTTEGEGDQAEATDDHGEAAGPVHTDNEHIAFDHLGIFGQAERLLDLEGDEVLTVDGEQVVYLYNGTPLMAYYDGEGRRLPVDGAGNPLTLDSDDTIVYDDAGQAVVAEDATQAVRYRDRMVKIGPFELDIQTLLVVVTLFMLLGAAGKSAQIPLFVWLPDAMAGPTPVSALIHAATMVTAGVYMMVRSSVFFHAADFTSLIVALVGATTALMAGYIALGQWDIKRVLAYSTISQLGFMVAAVGVGAYVAAMFHLVTHACFKALLFLGSGSVIHGVEHGHHHAREHGDGDHHDEHFDPQDMRNMGGLRNKMPITFWTYLIGTLALAGIFPFAGFWSKDEILADSWVSGLGSETFSGQIGGFVALGLLLLAAGMTAFYMWRQMELVFFGKARTEAAEHAPESTFSMTFVLIVLGILSIFAGFFNTPSNVLGLEGIFGAHGFSTFLIPSVPYAHTGEFQPLIALGALAIGLGAIYVARSIYGHGKALTHSGHDPLQVNPTTGAIWSLANARLYWDETYDRLFIRPFNRIATFLADTLDWALLHDYVHDTVIKNGFNTIGDLLSRPFDLGVIDGAVNGVGRVVRWLAGQMRQVQTGYIRTYAFALLLGVVLVIIIMLLPLLQGG